MSESDIDTLYSKINSTREELVVACTRLDGLDARLASVEAKIDRAQWFAVAQLVALAMMLLMYIIGRTGNA